MSMEAATENECQPVVDGRYDGTSSWGDKDERRRWRPGRSATWTSWSYQHYEATTQSCPVQVNVDFYSMTSGRDAFSSPD